LRKFLKYFKIHSLQYSTRSPQRTYHFTHDFATSWTQTTRSRGHPLQLVQLEFVVIAHEVLLALIGVLCPKPSNVMTWSNIKRLREGFHAQSTDQENGFQPRH